MGVARRPFGLRVDLTDGSTMLLDRVEEYVSGFKYLYVRCVNRTLSFDRDAVASVWRRMADDHDWAGVNLRGQKKHSD